VGSVPARQDRFHQGAAASRMAWRGRSSDVHRGSGSRALRAGNGRSRSLTCWLGKVAGGGREWRCPAV